MKEIVPLMTRLPADLHAELKQLAGAQERSLNWLIVDMLRGAVRAQHAGEAQAAAAPVKRAARPARR